MAKRLNIVIPVYNEGANFAALWSELSARVHSDFTAYVVFDFDEDDTLPVVEALLSRGETRLRFLKNRIRPGVVGAIQTGFDEVRHGPVLVAMADLSDDLGVVDEMLALYAQGHHIVVGSRYMRGGRIEGGPLFKQSLSRLAGLTLHWFRRIPTHDATNAFKIYDAEMVRSLNIESRFGFELNLEITVKGFLAGYAIAEVPCTWKNRTAGKSRFRLWKWLPHYLRWYFYAFQPQHVSEAGPVPSQVAEPQRFDQHAQHTAEGPLH
jgi:glycosyltransferase involved in cell wall biosynthesis